jgi:threonine dehydrogenase-like Zn-dependent dehydrogenase
MSSTRSRRRPSSAPTVSLDPPGIVACRKGGRVSMPAVYGGIVDKFPLGAFMEKGLTLKTGQTHVQHYMPGLLNAIMEERSIRPS